MKYKLFIIIGIILGTISAMSLHGQVTCVTKAPRQISAGQAFYLIYELNEKPDKLPSINFANFRYAGGPSQGT